MILKNYMLVSLKLYSNQKLRLVEAGFKIAIVEQTETPKQLKERLKSDRSSEKAVKRKLYGILTKDTYFKYEEDMNSINNTNRHNKKNQFC